MTSISIMSHSNRWDSPFDSDFSDHDVNKVLERKEFSSIDKSRFPASLSLRDIINNDCRVVSYEAGELVVREGDYGNSAFLILSGELTVVVRPGLPSALLGRTPTAKKSRWQSLSQLWNKSSISEARGTSFYKNNKEQYSKQSQLKRVSLLNTRYSNQIFKSPLEQKLNLNDVPALKDQFETVQLEEGDVFGEIAALGRVQRTASIFSQSNSVLLEIRWQGLRDLRKYDEGWRSLIDKTYRKNLLKDHLLEHFMFKKLDETTLKIILDNVLFETYGSYEWHHEYSKEIGDDSERHDIIAHEGDYTDGVLLVAAGFAKVSIKAGNGDRTLSYLRKGDCYGFDELYSSWKLGQEISLETTLSSLGYVHVIRIPSHILDKYVFPELKELPDRLSNASKRPLASDSLLDWSVKKRFINGTQAMLINLDKCIRCDDCVQACSDTHDGNPRFIRHGHTHGAQMVANACMHCIDPVCMIGCPTGAIHRSLEEGVVVINDDTCIGCSTCAKACPYDNIRMVSIRDENNHSIIDSINNQEVLKATKCDLCVDQRNGPACENACAQNALARVDFHKLDFFK